MKTLLIFVCGIVLTLFCCDYQNLRHKVKCHDYEIEHVDKAVWEGEPGDDDKGLVWQHLVLRDKVDELESRLEELEDEGVGIEKR